MDKFLEKMRTDGLSNEEILKEVKSQLEAYDEKAKRKEALTNARTELIIATLNYLEELDPTMTTAELEEIGYRLDKVLREAEG